MMENQTLKIRFHRVLDSVMVFENSDEELDYAMYQESTREVMLGQGIAPPGIQQ